MQNLNTPTQKLRGLWLTLGFSVAFKRLKQKGVEKASIKKGLGVHISTLSYLKKQCHVSVVLTKVQKAIKHSLNWRTATGR
jgi:hypothetical protein